MNQEYKGFDACLKLRELGFPQVRSYQSMYYVTPDKLMCIDDWSALKAESEIYGSPKTVVTDVTTHMVFRPRLEDLLDESPFLHEVIKMNDGTWMAYSTIEEDPAYIARTGRQDKMIRSPGPTMRDALISLWIDVKSKLQLQMASTVLSEKEGVAEVGVLEDRADQASDGTDIADITKLSPSL